MEKLSNGKEITYKKRKGKGKKRFRLSDVQYDVVFLHSFETQTHSYMHTYEHAYTQIRTRTYMYVSSGSKFLIKFLSGIDDLFEYFLSCCRTLYPSFFLIFRTLFFSIQIISKRSPIKFTIYRFFSIFLLLFFSFSSIIPSIILSY